MKKLLMVMILAVCGLRGATEMTNYPSQDTWAPGLCLNPISSTATYALNTALTGVASSAIDASAAYGIYIFVTGTGTALTGIEWSIDNANTTTAWAPAYTFQKIGGACLSLMGRYVRFRNVGTCGACTTSLRYVLGSAPSISVTGTTSSTVSVTQTVVGVWTIVSNTTRTITAPVMLNLTSVAGTTGVMKYQFSASNSNSAGVYWDVTANSTWAFPKSYYSTTTTPLIDDNLVAGTHLNLSPTSATDISCTVQVIISKLSLVNP